MYSVPFARDGETIENLVKVAVEAVKHSETSSGVRFRITRSPDCGESNFDPGTSFHQLLVCSKKAF